MTLAAVGRATNTLEEPAWADRSWPKPPVGFLCGEMHTQPAPFWRSPCDDIAISPRQCGRPHSAAGTRCSGLPTIELPPPDAQDADDDVCASDPHPSGGSVWLALRGGHCTTVLSETCFSDTPAAPVTTFYFLDGLRSTVETRHVVLESPITPPPPSVASSSRPSQALVDPKIVDILAVRSVAGGPRCPSSSSGAPPLPPPVREFQCICAADGPLEGVPRNPTSSARMGGRWYCRSCWLSTPRVYA